MSSSPCVQTITAGLVVDEPYCYACYKDWWTTKQCTVGPGPGLEVETMMTLMHSLLKIPNLIFYEAKDYDELTDGFKNGIFDIYFLSYQIHAEELVTTEATPVVGYASVALLVKEQTNTADTSLINVFTYDLWLAVVATLLCIFAFEFFYSKYIRSLGSTRPWHQESRILYCITAGIVLNLICNVYSNMMAIALFNKDQMSIFPFTDLVDLGHKLIEGKCKLVVLDRYVDDEDFWTSFVVPENVHKPWASLFLEAYNVNPPIQVTNRDEMADQVLKSTSGLAFVGMDYNDLSVYYSSRYCNLKLQPFPDDLPLRSYVFYYQKNTSCLTNVLMEVMATNTFFSFASQRQKTKYYSKDVSLPCSSSDSSSVSSLTVSQLSEAFYLFLSGIIVAFLIYLYEYIYHQLAVRRLKRIYARMQWRALVARRKVPLTEIM